MSEEQFYDGQSLVRLYHQLRYDGVFLIWGALLLFIIIVVLGAALNQKPPNYNKIGVHLLLDDGRNRWDEALWAEHLQYAGAMAGKGGIAVQVIRADDLVVTRWQQFLDLCQTNELTPVLRLATIFDRTNGYWLPPQADTDGSYHTVGKQYADFLAALDWRGMTPHIILLNEPNNGHEWGGTPDPEAYARFLVEVAEEIQHVLPHAKLLNGALDLYAPNTGSAPFPETNIAYIDADTFLQRMIAAEPHVFRKIAIWNSHSYPLGAFRASPAEQVYQFDRLNDAPALTRTPPAQIYNRGINGYEWELWRLGTLGVASLPVMITETGWRIALDAPDSADAGTGYPDEATATEYLRLAMLGEANANWSAWLLDERVIGIALFALNGTPEEWAHTNLLHLAANGEILGTRALYDWLVTIQQP